MKFFKTAYKYWMIFAKKLSIIPSTIILIIIYSACIGAVSIINFILRKDLLCKRPVKSDTYWLDKEQIPANLERCKRQF